MIFEEFRQSATSPLKYRVELTPEELERVKDLVYQIIKRIKEDEKN
jgi:hypothetical protein|tara:strand:- start:1986 stop:2123 length:138 start_codon:yes stop_codon:yes gene_type:complete